MEESEIQHRRRSIRLPGVDYSEAGGYFITICSYRHVNDFGKIIDNEMHLSPIGKIAFEQWNCLPTRFYYIELDVFVVMPNHIHGIIALRAQGTGVRLRNEIPSIHPCAPTVDQENDQRKFGKAIPGTIPTIIRAYKSAVSIRVNHLLEWRGDALWQRNYYEHILRNEDDWQKTRDYILNNPSRWQQDRLFQSSNPSVGAQG